MSFIVCIFTHRGFAPAQQTKQKMILIECRLYTVYDSGASHGIYALFMAYAALHNNGKEIGLLRGCSMRMALLFIAMDGSL